MVNYITRKFEYVFLALASVMGLVYIIVTPPFQSPDEYNHFYKIYHIASGEWRGEMNDSRTSLGGTIPSSLVHISEPFLKITNQPDSITHRGTIVKHLNYPLEPQKVQFVDFPNTARYSPTAYLPQIAAVWLFKTLNMPPLWMTYGCRLSAFLSWLLLVFYSLRLAPPKVKEILCVLALLPMSIAINSTMNADVFTNGLIFLVISMMLRWRFQNTPLSIGSLSILFLSFLLISINKICYFPLIAVLAIVPKERFGGMLKKSRYVSALSIASLLIIFVWIKYVDTLIYPDPTDITKTTYSLLNPNTTAVNPKLQLLYIESHILQFVPQFVTRSFLTYWTHHRLFLGSFGWEGNCMPSGLAYILWGFIVVFIGSLKTDFTRWERWSAIGLAQCMTFLFLLSQYLHWDAVGGEITYWYLPKYFIPMYPFFAFAITGFASRFIPNNKWLNLTMILLLITAHIDMFVLLFQRYYF